MTEHKHFTKELCWCHEARFSDQLEHWCSSPQRDEGHCLSVNYENIQSVLSEIREAWDLIDKLTPYVKAVWLGDPTENAALLAEVEEKRQPHGQ